MTDRIVLANMAFEARHGVHDWEKVKPQRFEVDIELGVDLTAAARSDELPDTVDYVRAYDIVRETVLERQFDLIESLAATIAAGLLAGDRRIESVTVRVRKPDIRLGGPLDHAAVEVRRTQGQTER